MAFEVRMFAEARPATAPATCTNSSTPTRRVRAEVWPQWGFNCLRWQVRQPDGRWADILYTAPDWETNPVPDAQRAPDPVPVPRPAARRAAHVRGQDVPAPAQRLDEAARDPRVHPAEPVARDRLRTATTEFAFVTGRVQPERRTCPRRCRLWPADFVLSVTYRLYRRPAARGRAASRTSGPVRCRSGSATTRTSACPGVNDPDIGGHVLQANVERGLGGDEDNLPTGGRKDVPPELDFRNPTADRRDGTRPRLHRRDRHASTEPAGWSSWRRCRTRRRRAGSACWPTRRSANWCCSPRRTGRRSPIEPYTCSADAANLAARGIDSGWRVLATRARVGGGGRVPLGAGES